MTRHARTPAPQPEHRHRGGIPDRRPGVARSPLAHPGRNSAKGQGASVGARQAGDAPVGGGDRHGRVPEHPGGRGGDPLHPPADRHPGPRKRPAAGGRRHASLRPVARAGDLPRRPLPPIVEDLQHGGARQPDLRTARPHRRGGPRDRHSAHERRALLPAAPPGAFGQLAVLAGHGHRAALVPLQGVRQVPAHQYPGPVLRAGANSRTTSIC